MCPHRDWFGGVGVGVCAEGPVAPHATFVCVYQLCKRWRVCLGMAAPVATSRTHQLMCCVLVSSSGWAFALPHSYVRDSWRVCLGWRRLLPLALIGLCAGGRGQVSRGVCVLSTLACTVLWPDGILGVCTEAPLASQNFGTSVRVLATLACIVRIALLFVVVGRSSSHCMLLLQNTMHVGIGLQDLHL
jgi:hypothetical protein